MSKGIFSSSGGQTQSTFLPPQLLIPWHVSRRYFFYAKPNAVLTRYLTLSTKTSSKPCYRLCRPPLLDFQEGTGGRICPPLRMPPATEEACSPAHFRNCLFLLLRSWNTALPKRLLPRHSRPISETTAHLPSRRRGKSNLCHLSTFAADTRFCFSSSTYSSRSYKGKRKVPVMFSGLNFLQNTQQLLAFHPKVPLIKTMFPALQGAGVRETIIEWPAICFCAYYLNISKPDVQRLRA